jgi:hypothetical protein
MLIGFVLGVGSRMAAAAAAADNIYALAIELAVAAANKSFIPQFISLPPHPSLLPEQKLVNTPITSAPDPLPP